MIKSHIPWSHFVGLSIKTSGQLQCWPTPFIYVIPFTYSLFVDVKECENNKCLCSLSDIVEQAEIIDGDCL